MGSKGDSYDNALAETVNGLGEAGDGPDVASEREALRTGSGLNPPKPTDLASLGLPARQNVE